MSADTLQLFAEYLASQQWQKVQVLGGTGVIATRGPWVLQAYSSSDGVRISLHTFQHGFNVLTSDILHRGGHDLIYWARDPDPVKALVMTTAQVHSALDRLRARFLSELERFKLDDETLPVADPTPKV